MYPWFTQLLKDLQQRILKQQLHHGLLLLSDKGLGVSQLINELGKSILCEHHNACGKCKSCKLFDAESHPDLKKVFSDKPSIGVDLIREVGDFVNTTSQLLNNKVVIIEDIERLTESSSNSLLKTLEEPSQNTYLVLSTSSANSVLATIRSRCEKVTINKPEIDQALSWVSSQTSQPATKEGLLAFSSRPLEYLESLNDQSLNYNTFVQSFTELIEHNASAIKVSEQFKDDAEKVLSWSYQLLSQKYKYLLLSQGADSRNHRQVNIDLGTISKAADLCKQANIKISQAGINRSLLLQKVFNNIQNSLSTVK